MATLAPNTKSVLITGCSEGGIGAALAIAFQKTGQYHVFATARTISKIPAELSADEERVTVLALDVVSRDSIEKAAQAVAKKTRARLDILINNSGSAMLGMPAVDVDVKLAKAMFDVNYFGVMSVTQTFLPLLVMAKGAIVNNSSVAGERMILYNGNYAATKTALNMYSECLRLEVAALGVRVLILVTGTVHTKVFDNQPAITLPDNSFFAPIASVLQDLPVKMAAMNRMHANEYAQQVVQTIESGASGKVYLGGLVGIFKYFAWWLPNWVWDRMNLARNPQQVQLTVAADKWRSEASA